MSVHAEKTNQKYHKFKERDEKTPEDVPGQLNLQISEVLLVSAELPLLLIEFGLSFLFLFLLTFLSRTFVWFVLECYMTSTLKWHDIFVVMFCFP
jgi:hypothetical protein